MVLVERFAQALSPLLGFELKQQAVHQVKMLAIHPLDLLMQNGLQLLRFNRHWLRRRLHEGKVAEFCNNWKPFWLIPDL